jgi:cytochrome c peroxidase
VSRTSLIVILCLLTLGGADAGDTLRSIYSRPIGEWPTLRTDQAVFVELGPLPPVQLAAGAAQKAELGARLFADAGLSAAGNISCTSCHAPSAGFSVPTPTATGVDGTKGRRNPTALWDTPHRATFGWDGGSADLHERLLQPLTERSEMGNADIAGVLRRLENEPAYRTKFQAVFDPGDITAGHLAEALAVYLAAQARPSRFDLFLSGNTEALADDEILGLHLFRTKAGCVSCHFGPRFTDDGFHNLGLSSFREPSEDLGRFRITGQAEDIGRFQTPSLRQVATSAPYMHHGLFDTLEGVVNFYARGGGEIWARNAREAADPAYVYAAALSPQIQPLELSAAEKAALVAFLKTL